MGPLTHWVFHRVARDLLSRHDWPTGFRIYFNLATQMLEDIAFITMLDRSLRANPTLARHLGIEVTESAAMQNVERSMNTIDLFRRLGVSVAIDDFGTGHSSLSYLKNLTVDVIKIDRSFVNGLSSDDRDNAIVEMMLGITDRFGFASLAEGIETEAQLSWLRNRGCQFGQGYLIAKPNEFKILLGLLDKTCAA
jgi:EAL domain-containing protein (putative c-di-GMP-specific phosphodiesterase class I)